MENLPFQIVPVSPVAVGGLVWRRGGRLRASIIVKATFAFAPGLMPLADPVAIRTDEVHHGGSPARSIREGVDVVPPLSHAEVLFVGHAHAPGGEPVTTMRARLAVVRNQWPLVDKTLEITGDRTARGGDPRPFTRMELTYERAAGGAGSVDNPLGLGAGKSPDRALPNVAYADPGNAAPASFGPISHYWPSRKRFLQGRPRKLFDAPIVELPDDFDVEYFQSAPRDQRFSSLRGDEYIVLEGLHPTEPNLALRLPGARAAARLHTADGQQMPVALAADTLLIDGDAGRCAVVWRGSHVIPSEETLAGMLVLAGVELPGQPIDWPSVPPARQRMGTVVLPDASDAVPPPRAGTLVIEPAAPAAGRRGTVVLPDTAPPAPRTRMGTMVLPDAAAPPAPREEQKSTVILPTAALIPGIVPTLMDDEEGLMETAYGDPSATPQPVAPFAIAAPGSSPGHVAPIPGAPWAPGNPAARPPRPSPSWESTLDITPDDPSADAPTLKVKVTRPLPPLPPRDAAPQPAADAVSSVPVAAAAAAPDKPLVDEAPAPEKPAPKPWSWRTDEPRPAPEPPKPTPKRPQPKISVQKSIYGKFGGGKK